MNSQFLIGLLAGRGVTVKPPENPLDADDYLSDLVRQHLATLDAEIASLRGKLAKAEQLLKGGAAALGNEAAGQVSPADARAAFEALVRERESQGLPYASAQAAVRGLRPDLWAAMHSPTSALANDLDEVPAEPVLTAHLAARLKLKPDLAPGAWSIIWRTIKGRVESPDFGAIARVLIAWTAGRDGKTPTEADAIVAETFPELYQAAAAAKTKAIENALATHPHLRTQLGLPGDAGLDEIAVALEANRGHLHSRNNPALWSALVGWCRGKFGMRCDAEKIALQRYPEIGRAVGRYA